MPALHKLCAIVLDKMSMKESLLYNVEGDYVEGCEVVIQPCLIFILINILWLVPTQNVLEYCLQQCS